MDIYRTLAAVVEDLRTAKDRGRGCTLLIGAGCSVKAGVPAAQGFVDAIEERYGQAYTRAAKKTYPMCMAQLAPTMRRDLIVEYVDNARIN